MSFVDEKKKNVMASNALTLYYYYYYYVVVDVDVDVDAVEAVRFGLCALVALVLFVSVVYGCTKK